MSQPDANPPAPSAPKFDPGAAHMRRPKLRPVRGFPAQGKGPDGQEVQLIGLADARQISDKVMFTMPAAQMVFPLMDGTRDIDQIVREVGRGLTPQILQSIVAQLDDACLLEGPTFDKLWSKVKAEFDSATNLPPGSTAAFADSLVVSALGQNVDESVKSEQGPSRVRDLFNQWMDKALEKAEKPSFDQLPRAVVVPHVDYPRGWINYAHVYGRMRVCDRPDRVIVLGTNHFGQGTGVVGCDKGYTTPLGTCEVDSDVVHALNFALGDKFLANRYDHEREHSVELQMMWIQHVFGADENGRFPRVFGALVHDPAVANGESYDGNGVALEPFVKALKDCVSSLPGRTLIVASADLSHAGPAFGDKQTLAGDSPEADAARKRVFQHDMGMLDLVRQNKPGELVAAMAWQQNPTRWCSTGNIVATLLTVEPSRVEMLNYAASIDQPGTTMVSSFAAAMW